MSGLQDRDYRAVSGCGGPEATRTPSASSSQGMLVATMAKGQYRNRLCGTGPEEHYMLAQSTGK